MGKLKNQIQERWSDSDTGEKVNIVFGVIDIISGAISLFTLGKAFFGKKDNEEEDN